MQNLKTNYIKMYSWDKDQMMEHPCKYQDILKDTAKDETARYRMHIQNHNCAILYKRVFNQC